jgi:quercetin dioxygenase-like cupin family protein
MVAGPAARQWRRAGSRILSGGLTMKRIIYGLALVTSAGTSIPGAAADVRIDNLLRGDLQVVDGAEVIVSVVEIGPGLTLPKHYHPGEEFIYLLEGSATVWQQGKPDVVLHAGDVFRVPLEQVHTAMTSESSAKAVIFRIHRKGAPDRIPVE